MTENRFHLLSAKVSEETKRGEDVSRLMAAFTGVLQETGLGFDDARVALDRIAYLMRQTETPPK